MLSLPEAQWQGELQNAAQRLVQAGVPPEQIQNFQLSRQNLEGVIAQSRDIEKLREEAQPHWQSCRG
jgi:hypothetical protein